MSLFAALLIAPAASAQSQYPQNSGTRFASVDRNTKENDDSFQTPLGAYMSGINEGNCNHGMTHQCQSIDNLPTIRSMMAPMHKGLIWLFEMACNVHESFR